LGSGLAAGWGYALSSLSIRFVEALAPACIIVSIAAQALFVFVRREYDAPWWRVAFSYAIMLLFLDPVLANPHTGAITRVMLPLTVGFNVLLARESRATPFWSWFVAGNLHLLPAYYVVPLVPWS
jgi:hypothetical protein